MYEAAGRQRKATIGDMSLGSPMRPAGDRDIKSSTFLFTSAVSYHNNNPWFWVWNPTHLIIFSSVWFLINFCKVSQSLINVQN